MIDAYHIYLNGSEVMLRRQTGWGRWYRVEDITRWQWDAGTPASLNFDAIELRKRRYATLAVHVGSALGKFMIFQLPPGLQGEQEERAAAEAQMQYQLGLNPGQWEFTLDHLPARGKVVACALRADIVARLRQVAREHGLRLLSVRPYVAGVWNAMQLRCGPATLNDGRAMMMVERDAFTIVIEKEGKMDAMSAMTHRREAEVINREIRRMAYSLGEDAQRHAYLMVAGELLPLAQLHVDKVVRHENLLQPILYADFRDLLFHPPAQGIP
ncbi:hypothetical protein O0881_21050 [Janthinobacterium sp. SUN100]|uniref:hypothetical protein n=1 Tax=Janthinobacterium sp. SUN100 TaxID=3004101 RepID=UPI0025B09E54|nr:hypothetical protein [Janthinobacterium sp. SUN100]MDN2704473.1 hypothetical protein [Janthinobacterium sp. SUN100]